MILFPNAKINLGLQVLARRADGYHDLRSIFYPLAIHDVLEIIPVTERDEASLPDAARSSSFYQTQFSSVIFSMSGSTIDGDAGNNLCMKAIDLVKKNYALPPLQLHLHKQIPIGAGLGGGSSDGAHTLLLLNQIFDLNLSSGQLLHYALQLGSDCPFFIINRPCLAEGRGERLQPLQLDLSSFSILVVDPGIHISTAWAFSKLDTSRLSKPKIPLEEIVHMDVSLWKDCLTNDFEQVVMNEYPSIALVKQRLYEQGALYASLSGSGSAVFGIFKKNESPHSIPGCASFHIY